MPQQPLDSERAARQYDETTAAANPPNSVLRPEVRRTAVWTYLGILVAFFLIAGAGFLYWVAAGPGARVDDRTDASAVGTSGEPLARGDTPGGFDPAPRSRSTADEIEYRGGTMSARPATEQDAAITSLRALRDAGSQRLDGRRIDLVDVEVERVDAGMVAVRDGDERATVVIAGGMSRVQAGQRVDLSGTLEQDGASTRIHATRIDVR